MATSTKNTIVQSIDNSSRNALAHAGDVFSTQVTHLPQPTHERALERKLLTRRTTRDTHAGTHVESKPELSPERIGGTHHSDDFFFVGYGSRS